MRGMKNSGIKWIGNIPSSWCVLPFYAFLDNRVDAIADGPFGSDMKNEEYVEEGVPIIQLGSIRDNGMDFSRMNYITDEKADTLLRHNAFPHNIAIAKMMPAGKACEVPDKYPRYVVSADVIRAYVTDKTIRSFLIYALNSYATKQAEIESQGSTRARVNIAKVKRFKIAFPSNAQDISSIISYLDSKCEEIDAISADIRSEIDILEEYKKSVIAEAVTKGINHNQQTKDSGIEWIGDIATGYEVLKLKYMADILDQYRSPIAADKRSQEAETLYDYYGASGVIDKIDGYTIDDHVMLIGEDGANLRMRNLPLMYEVNGKAWINNHAHILKPKNITSFYYLFYTLESIDINPYITGSAQPKLSQEKLKEIKLPAPEFIEQEEIAQYLIEKVPEIDSLIIEMNSLVEIINEYKHSLIYEYITGKKEAPLA